MKAKLFAFLFLVSFAVNSHALTKASYESTPNSCASEQTYNSCNNHRYWKPAMLIGFISGRFGAAAGTLWAHAELHNIEYDFLYSFVGEPIIRRLLTLILTYNIKQKYFKEDGSVIFLHSLPDENRFICRTSQISSWMGFIMAQIVYKNEPGSIVQSMVFGMVVHYLMETIFPDVIFCKSLDFN